MEIYVKDEDMPKTCWECPCLDGERDICQINNYLEDRGFNYLRYNRHKDCPLKPLSQALDQARKEEREKVCEEIRKSAEDKYTEESYIGEIPVSWVISEEKLLEIEKIKEKQNE